MVTTNTTNNIILLSLQTSRLLRMSQRTSNSEALTVFTSIGCGAQGSLGTHEAQAAQLPWQAAPASRESHKLIPPRESQHLKGST